MAKPKLTIKIIGEPELYRRLRAIVGIVRKEMSAVLEREAHRGAELAWRAAPSRTGALKDSIEHRGKGLSWQYGSFEYGERGRPVGWWVEHGTSRTPAQPFLRGTIDSVTSSIQSRTSIVAQALPFEVSKA